MSLRKHCKALFSNSCSHGNMPSANLLQSCMVSVHLTEIDQKCIFSHFKQINVVLVCTSCLLDTVYNKQRLNIRFGHLEIGLDRGFVKRCLNFV